MKKILSAILLLVILILPASALADTTYFVHGLDMQISLPDNFDVMTRNMEDDNPLISLYGENAEEVRAFMAEQDSYLLGTDYENYFIAVGMFDSDDTESMSDYTDKELKAIEMALAREVGSSDASFVEHPQIKFFRYERVADEQAQIGYITFENGKQLMIGIISLEAELTEEMSAFSDKILNSVYLGNSTFGEGWKKQTKEGETYLQETGWIFDIALILLLVYICIVPVLIYRFGIRKRPVQPGRAKWIAAIIAIALLVLLMIMGKYSIQNRSLKIVAVICQFINYHIMVCGIKKYSQPEASIAEVEETQQPERVETISFTLNSEEDIVELRNKLQSLMVCPDCGTELLNGTKKCHNCGKDLEE